MHLGGVKISELVNRTKRSCMQIFEYAVLLGNGAETGKVMEIRKIGGMKC
jgi:hypothetical protein